MALEGSLQELPLADLLQLMHLTRRSGVLSIKSELGPRAEILFDGGAVVGCRSDEEGRRLGHLLVASGRASDAQLRNALLQQHELPERRLGMLLVEQGMAAAEVERSLRFQIRETVLDL